jgi:hypothetical protein
VCRFAVSTLAVSLRDFLFATLVCDARAPATPNAHALARTPLTTQRSHYIASIARRVYVKGGVGVGWLSRAYGANSKNGVRANHKKVAATGVIRSCIQSLEKLNVLEQSKNG